MWHFFPIIGKYIQLYTYTAACFPLFLLCLSSGIFSRLGQTSLSTVYLTQVASCVRMILKAPPPTILTSLPRCDMCRLIHIYNPSMHLDWWIRVNFMLGLQKVPVVQDCIYIHVIVKCCPWEFELYNQRSRSPLFIIITNQIYRHNYTTKRDITNYK